MSKNKRSKTNNNLEVDEDYFDDYRQERKRRQIRRERRKNKRTMVDDAIELEYLEYDDDGDFQDNDY